MTQHKFIIPAVCAAVSLYPVPTVASDAGQVIGGIIGGFLGAAARDQQQNTRSRQVRRAPNPQRQQNRQVQTSLNAFGFPVGAVDGALGPKSRAAIRNYQDYMGYPSTGQLTDYERTTLLEGYNRYNAGGGQAYPKVVANEGTKGLLKAFSDPNYANKYRQQANTGTYGVTQDQVAGEQGGRAATLGAGGALPELDLTRGSTPVSIATHCEVVSGMTQVNGGAILASDVADPDQALGEQFCDARSYAMTQGQALMTNVRATDEQMNELCTQIADKMAPAVAMATKENVKVVTTEAMEIANKIYNGNMGMAAGYGQICLSTGYRQDDAAVALGGTMSLVAAGEMPYTEIVGHHARWGFGMPQTRKASRIWYEAALSAMDNGAQPAFLPSKTADRNAVIRAALSSPRRPVPKVADEKDDELALPALELGD